MFDVLPYCISHTILFHHHLLQQSCCPNRYHTRYLRQLHFFAPTNSQTSLCNRGDIAYLDQSIEQAHQSFLNDSCVALLYCTLLYFLVVAVVLSLRLSFASFVKFSRSDPSHSCWELFTQLLVLGVQYQKL